MKNSKQIYAGLLIVVLIAGAVFVIKKLHPVQTAALNGGGTAAKTKGPENAPVTMVEYSDFQCPACGAAQAEVHSLLDRYPDKIKVVYRHFPLKQHQWAPVAHQSAECASRQGKFWEFHDWLFVTQKEWSTSIENPVQVFMVHAKELNLDLDAFAVCLENPQTKDTILQERAQGDALQINSTPTFFINGERVVGPNELKAKGDEIIRKILGMPPAEPQPAPASAPEPAKPV